MVSRYGAQNSEGLAICYVAHCLRWQRVPPSGFRVGYSRLLNMRAAISKPAYCIVFVLTQTRIEPLISRLRCKCSNHCLKWKVGGSSRGAYWPDLKLTAFFPSGPRWQMWLEHRDNYYMPPTTTFMHVGKYVRYLPKVGGFLRALRFPPPIKLTATI